MVDTTTRQFLSTLQFLNIAYCPFFYPQNFDHSLRILAEIWNFKQCCLFYYLTQVTEFLVNEVPGNVGVKVARAIPSTYPGHFWQP